MRADFSKIIHRLRMEKGLSQRRVAAELGISQALLSHYENGVREPKLPFVKKICGYYGVSADHLLGCDDAAQGKISLVCGSDAAAAALSAVSEALDAAGDEKRLAAAAKYAETVAGYMRGILENPNAPYDQRRFLKIKTAESALYEAARLEETSEE
jgi:transcriptional regulator with XRE-family HTH domain